VNRRGLAVSAAVLVGLLALPGVAAAADVVKVPPSTVYSRAETKRISQELAQNTAMVTALDRTLGSVCNGTNLVCGPQYTIQRINYDLTKDNFAQAAEADKCVRIDWSPNPPADAPPVSRVDNSDRCVP
jgi:hypothetical protein